MPKRLTALLLAFLCLFAGSSIAVHQHHCMGKVAGTNLAPVTPDDHHRCDRCGMKRSSSKGCCEDVLKIVKGQDSHRFYPAPYSMPVLEWIVPVQKPVYRAAAHPIASAAFSRQQLNRPPPEQGPRFLRLRVLRL